MKKEVLVITSSNNKQGNSNFLTSLFVSKANLDLYKFSFVNLYDLNIEYLSQKNREANIEKDPASKDVRELITQIENHQKIILSFPIWNAGIPGMLKNFLDRAGVSGRVWSEEKKQKIPGWGEKKFFLLITMGSNWPLSLLSRLAVLQVYLVLKYYGARIKVVQKVRNCGSGSKLVISSREKLINKMHKKSKKYFAK